MPSSPGKPETRLSVILGDDAVCNGVLVTTDDESLLNTDARETQHGYRRVNLRWSVLTVLADLEVEPGDVCYGN